MAEDLSFQEFLRRLAEGDFDAGVELMRRYGDALRATIYARRLGGPRPEASSVILSALADFWKHFKKSRYQFDTPEQLLGLLHKIAHYKLIDRWRRELRGGPREPGDVADREVVSPAA